MEINEITEGLDRDNHPRDGLFVVEGLTEKLLKGLIGALAELSQELSIKSEMGPEHLGDGEHVWQLLHLMRAKPFLRSPQPRY